LRGLFELLLLRLVWDGPKLRKALQRFVTEPLLAGHALRGFKTEDNHALGKIRRREHLNDSIELNCKLISSCSLAWADASSARF
jgi:hypothetical protein